AGLVFRHEKFVPASELANVAPWLGALGVGVAVADVDGDGRPDILVTNSRVGSKSALFINQGDGTFKDEAERAGLADLSSGEGALRPLFFDWDNDGRPDLLLTTTWCVRAFHNEGGGRFREVTDAAGIRFCGYAVASTALDYDGDGRLDVVIAGLYPPVRFTRPSTTVVMQDDIVHADNGGEVAVFHNDGGGRFHRVPGDLGLKGGGWTMSAASWDFDGDSRPDLYFAVDANTDRAYLNRGGGRFQDVSASLETPDSRQGMNADVATIQGRPAVFVTHVYRPPYLLGFNKLWAFDGAAGGFKDLPHALGAEDCGWGWGGKFVDLDLDGEPDLVVSNGFISGGRDKDYWPLLGPLAVAGGRTLADIRNWPPMAGYSLGGYQRDCVFHMQGGRLVDVSNAVGFAGERSDSRGIAVIDVRGDGRQDLVIGAEGQPLRFYRDVPPPANAWIGLRLRGTRSNRDAWGARVTVRLDGRTLERQLWPANGFMSQSDSGLVFGLGPARRVRDVTVRWPSGTVQDFGPLPAGRYHSLVERP
ncbi:MAG: CRTAC1 family protein, partial [Elusimicrobia bacterium]|nr:CRTAC1 family protein [Elusimicrobiota bacterium]